MHPIVTLFLLFAGLAAVGFLWLTRSAALLSILAMIRLMLPVSDGAAVLIIGGLIAVFIAAQFAAIIRKANWERQNNKRMKESLKAPIESQYTNRR